jgi:hypothetical protein
VIAPAGWLKYEDGLEYWHPGPRAETLVDGELPF